MNRLNYVAITAHPGNAKAIAAAAEATGCSGSVVEGDTETAVTLAGSWTVAPGCIVLDLSDAADPEAALKRVAEAAPEGETHLIIIGNANDIATYRRFRQIGAFEYLTSPITSDQMGDAFVELRRIAASRPVGVDPSKIIVVCGARGGNGTSMIAAAMAHGLAKHHRRKTLLVDLDIDAGCQYVNFNVEPTAGFVPMLSNPDSVDTLILNRTLAAPEPNLVLLSDNAPAEDSIDPKAPRTLIEHAARDLDCVVVDLPVRSPFAKPMIEAAGTLVVTATQTLYGLRDALAIFERLERLERSNVCSNPILAINRVGEVKSGAISTHTFRQKIARGADLEFRKLLERNIVELPYQPKTALLSTVRNQSCIEDNGPLGKALRSLLEHMPGVTAKRSSILSRLLGS